jgi:hypothetical protein
LMQGSPLPFFLLFLSNHRWPKMGVYIVNWTCILILPSLNWHHLFTIPSFTVPSPYSSTICLWISTGQTFWAFTNCMTYHTLHIAGFSIFMFIFSYSKWWESYDTVLCNTHVPPDILR